MSAQEDSLNLNQQLDFPKYSYTIFKENFCHAVPFSLHVSDQSAKRNFDFRLQARNIKDLNRQEVVHEMNLLWRIKQSQAILARIRYNNYIKIHYDHGINVWNNLKYNLYASINTRNLSAYNLRLGVHLIDKNFQSDTRLKVNNFLQPELTIYNRIVVNYGIWRLGLVGAYVPQKQIVSRSGAILGFQVDDKISLFGRIETKFKNSYLNSHFITNYLSLVYGFNSSTKGGVEVSYSYNTQKTKIEGLLEVKVNKFIDQFKVKMDNELASSWLVKFKTPALGQRTSHWFGLNYEKKQVKWGLRTEFNI